MEISLISENTEDFLWIFVFHFQIRRHDEIDEHICSVFCKCNNGTRNVSFEEQRRYEENTKCQCSVLWKNVSKNIFSSSRQKIALDGLTCCKNLSLSLSLSLFLSLSLSHIYIYIYNHQGVITLQIHLILFCHPSLLFIGLDKSSRRHRVPVQSL